MKPKKIASLVMALIMAFSAAAFTVEAKAADFNPGPYYITEHATIGSTDAGLIRAGLAGNEDDSTNFTKNPEGYWSGVTENRTAAGNVGSSRAAFIRFSLPSGISLDQISKLTVKFMVQYVHNGAPVVATLFELNEPLPATLTNGGPVKKDYSFKSLAANSNVITSMNAGVPLEFDLTDYILANPSKTTYEFEMLVNGVMLSLYDSTNATPANRPQFLLEERTPEIALSHITVPTFMADGDELPVSQDRYAITWTSSKPELLDGAKAVSASDDTETVFTASIDGMTREFNVIVLRKGVAQAGQEIVVRGADVDAAALNKNGLTYKGWGVLSCNSTSNLLMDYKSEAPEKYWELLEVLFGGDNPIVTHVKIEMGNDGNNSTGSDSCTMRYEDEEADASRSPGFQLAADAKLFNPDVKVSVLRWNAPNWTGSDYAKLYKWYSQTFFDAYEKYGYVVDYVNPNVNESSANVAMIKDMAGRIKNETAFPDYMNQAARDKYNAIKIITDDAIDAWPAVARMNSDPEFFDIVDAIGFHYVSGADQSVRNMADVSDKEVWNSEGVATFGYTEHQENKTVDSNGGGAGTLGGYQSPLAIVDTYINTFVYSRQTHYIFQPAIGAFYEGPQYGHKEYVSAREPWAGYLHYDEGLYTLGHFSKFAKTGWENESNTSGIWRAIPQASGGYAGNNNMNEHLSNLSGAYSYMTLAAPDKSAVSIVAVNNSPLSRTYHIKFEDMALSSTDLKVWLTKTDSYMQLDKTISQSGSGYYNYTLEPFSMATLTTTGNPGMSLPEDNEKAVLDTDSTGRVLDDTDEILYADDFEYEGYGNVEVGTQNGAKKSNISYLESRGNEPRYFVDGSGAFVVQDSPSGQKLGQILTASVSQWNNNTPNAGVGDHRWSNYKASVDVEVTPGTANYAAIAIRQQTGMSLESGYNFRIDGNGAWTLKRHSATVATGTVAANTEGKYRIALQGKNANITAYVDGIQVSQYLDTDKSLLFGRVKLGSSWALTYFDNLLVETVPGTVPYGTAFVDSHDDSVAYSGFTLSGPGGGDANNWYRTIAQSSTAGSTFELDITGTGIALSGAASTAAVLDVTVDGEPAVSSASTSASDARYISFLLGGLDNGPHTIIGTLKSGTLTIDGIYILGEYTPGPIDLELGLAGAAYAGEELPSQVKIKGELADILWSDDTIAAFAQAKAYDTFTGTGLTDTYSVTAVYEVVPRGLVYFVDIDNPSAPGQSPPFAAVKELVGDTLLNETSDQVKTADTAWGITSAFSQKGGNMNVYDKTATGIYGTSNASGVSLSYSFELKAGKYVITSAHREWWSGSNRPMRLTVSYGDTSLEAGTVPATVSTTVRSFTFELAEDQTVTYSVTSTGSQAPAVSWIAIQNLSPLLVLLDQYESEVSQYEFPALTEGYADEDLEEAQLVLKNLGTDVSEELVVEPESESFNIAFESPDGLLPGSSTALSIKPALGLEPGDYSETVSVAGIALTLKFIVLAKLYEFAVSAGEGGSVSGTESGSYKKGAPISVLAVPEDGYRFAGWTAEGIELDAASEAASEAEFEMPDQPVALEASFELIPKILSVTVSPSSVDLIAGSSQQFQATVEGVGDYNSEVLWSVSGGSFDTAISDTGILTLDSRETSGSALEVIATSVFDPAFSGAASVSIVDAPPDPVWDIALDRQGEYAFPELIEGYEVPVLEVKVTNIGNQPTGDLLISVSSADFVLNITAISSIEPLGEPAAFSVSPKEGLSAGVYNADVTVSGSDLAEEKSFKVSFTVLAAEPEVTPSPAEPTPPEVPETPEEPEVTPTPTEAPEVPEATPTPTEAPEVPATPTPTEAPEVPATPTPTEAPEVPEAPEPSATPAPPAASAPYTPPSNPVHTVPASENGVVQAPYTPEGSKAYLALSTAMVNHIAESGGIINFSNIGDVSSAVMAKTAAAAFANAGNPLEVAFSQGSAIFAPESLAQLAEVSKGIIQVSVKEAEVASLTASQQKATADSLVISLVVTVGNVPAIVPVELKIPYELKAGEKAEGIEASRLDKTGKLVPVKASYDKKAKAAIVKADEPGLYAISYTEPVVTPWFSPFIDIPESSPKSEAVRYVYENGLFAGTSPTSFSPEVAMTRGMIATVLGRLEKADVSAYTERTFSDVASNQYYAPYVQWAVSAGIATGTGNNSFSPESEITKEQLAVMLYNTLGVYGRISKYEKAVLADASQVSPWAANAADWAVSSGVFELDEKGALSPKSVVTRSEAAEALMRFSELQQA
ncbi:MAG: S-layer homology domain-containing protein [Clostridiales bacterium]|nr:S-layer homology domain-containing protein [Clostridiales bacterium]